MTINIRIAAIRIARRYAHEMIVATVPVIADFHFYVFIATIAMFVGLIAFELVKEGNI